MLKKITKRAPLLLAVLFLVSLVAVSGVLARYSTTVESDPKLATTEDFYFECNFEHGGLYLFPAQRDFVFVVKNYDPFDHVSASNITFDVTLDGEEIESNQMLETGEISTKTVTIPQDKLTLGKTHKVVITSRTPFVKTISFDIFVVEDKAGSFYTLADHGNWVQLDLYIGSDVPSSLTIDYNGFAPDNTHSLMRGWIEETKVTLYSTDLHPYTHYSLIFFGTTQINEVSEKTALPESITIQKSGQ